MRIFSEFFFVFDSQIPVMPTKKFKMYPADNAKPFCVTAPCTIPLQTDIDLVVRQCTIAPITEPVEWCASIIVTPEGNSDMINSMADVGGFSVLDKFSLLMAGARDRWFVGRIPNSCYVHHILTIAIVKTTDC